MIPGRRHSWLAVYRQEHRTTRLTLQGPMFRVLQSLCDGTPFAQALATTTASADEVEGWFETWAAEGLFAGVIRPEPLHRQGQP